MSSHRVLLCLLGLVHRRQVEVSAFWHCLRGSWGFREFMELGFQVFGNYLKFSSSLFQDVLGMRNSVANRVFKGENWWGWREGAHEAGDSFRFRCDFSIAGSSSASTQFHQTWMSHCLCAVNLNERLLNYFCCLEKRNIIPGDKIIKFYYVQTSAIYFRVLFSQGYHLEKWHRLFMAWKFHCQNILPGKYNTL